MVEYLDRDEYEGKVCTIGIGLRLEWIGEASGKWLITYKCEFFGLQRSQRTQAAEILTRALASSICETAMAYWNGTNTQYINKTACYQYLTQEVREVYNLGRNTVLCRIVHQNMVLFRPSIYWYVTVILDF